MDRLPLREGAKRRSVSSDPRNSSKPARPRISAGPNNLTLIAGPAPTARPGAVPRVPSAPSG